MFRFDPTSPGATLEACEAAIAAAYPVPEIRAAELADLLRRDAVMLVDLRSPPEQAVSRIPGSRAVADSTPPSALERLVATAIAADVPVVVYCAVGLRSARLVADWRGRRRALNLRGGIFRWAREGRPLAGESAAVHPFDARWGRLLDPSR